MIIMGFDSETDVSVLDRDDFCKLTSVGLKSLEAKKLECWCDPVSTRTENMLTSSLNTTTGATLLSPKTLKKRLLDFPDQFLQVQGDQLYCGTCCTNVGSSKSHVGVLDRSHTLSQKYQTCQNPPPIWASFSVTHSMLSPWNRESILCDTEKLTYCVSLR